MHAYFFSFHEKFIYLRIEIHNLTSLLFSHLYPLILLKRKQKAKILRIDLFQYVDFVWFYLLFFVLKLVVLVHFLLFVSGLYKILFL